MVFYTLHFIIILINRSEVKVCLFIKIHYAKENMRKFYLKLKFHLCSIPPQKLILQVHFSNAFNSIYFLREDDHEVRSHIPSMAVWMESCFCSQPVLYLGGHCKKYKLTAVMFEGVPHKVTLSRYQEFIFKPGI